METLTTTVNNSANKSVLSSTPFWMMNKSITIIEGGDLSLVLSHLESSFRYFTQEGAIFEGGIFYQNIPTITQHTGLKRSKIDKALKRLVELEFINKEAGKVPGTMTSTLYFSINTEIIEEWLEANPYKEEVKARKDGFFEKKALAPSILSKLRLKLRKKPVATTIEPDTTFETSKETVSTPIKWDENGYDCTPNQVMNYINKLNGTHYKMSMQDAENIQFALDECGDVWYGMTDSGIEEGLKHTIDRRFNREDGKGQGTSWYINR